MRAPLVAMLSFSACTGEIFDSAPTAPPAPAGPQTLAPVRPALATSPSMASGLPCALYEMLRVRCVSCHSAVPQGGAPFALVEREDLLALSVTHPGRTRAERSLARMKVGTMPPPPLQHTGADTTLLEDWLTGGVPGGECGQPELQPEPTPAGLTRASTATVALRLRALFPAFDLRRLTDGTGAGAALGQADQFDRFHAYRATDALAMRSARDLVLELCAVPDPVLAETGVWLAAETPPSDAAARLAVVAARRAWGTPVAASDPAVLELVALAAALRGDGATDLEVRRSTCAAVLLAPQFWLGIDLPEQRLLHLAVNLAARAPTDAEWAAWRGGTLDVAQWVRALQAEPGYLDTVADWHRTWLGPKDLRRVFLGQDPRGTKYHFAWAGANWLGGQIGVLHALPDGGTTSWQLRFNGQNLPNIGFTDADACESAAPEQPFEVESSELWYEQKNPAAAGAWQRVAGWVKSGGAWSPRAGQVTLADGGTLVTTLADIAFAAPATGGSFAYGTGRLQTTPLASFRAGHVRWLRVGASGVPQTGWSRARTWYSDQEVLVCNGLGRFLATCAYQPQTPAQGGPAAMGGTYPYRDGSDVSLDATRPAITLQTFDGATVYVSSLAHPTVLESFRCGVPVPGAGGLFPRGAPYNALMAGVRISRYAMRSDGAPVPEAVNLSVPEIAAQHAIADDVDRESEALVRDIVGQHLDYRSLLTADWTTVRGPTELAYRTQLYVVAQRPGPVDLSLVPRRVTSKTFSPLNDTWITNPGTGEKLQGPSPFGYRVADLRSPRPMAGILTQAAFLAPAGFKVRSVSARILRVLTCADISAYQPEAAATALHTPFIPHHEPTAASHLDPASGCYSCHVNLDPLAAALSSSFLESRTEAGRTFERLAAGGELGFYTPGDALESMSYGFRGTDAPSSGALMGKSVRGVREVARVLADSRPFARCAVQHAFEGLYGRLPQGTAEQALLDSATDAFMGPHAYDWDAMVRDLALSPLFGVAP